MRQSSSATVIEALVRSLDVAAAHNPSDTERPVAILWTDRDSQWLPVLPRPGGLMPQLLTLGEYAPEERTGPSIWLRCVVERAFESPKIPDEMTPVIYLPGTGRQELGAAQNCPDRLKPLVELQYRGTCWTQRNGRDWTVEAFLVSKDGGLGLDVARDSATRESMLRALAELATASVQALEGRRLEAEDFDRLFSDDPVRDLLVWLGDGGNVPAGWDSARWGAFASRCKADYAFDPENDGELVAAERLGRREGPWDSVWRRYAEAPALYPSVRDLLRMATPNDLFVGSLPAWPRTNEKGESDLQRALLGLESESPSVARERIIELEQTHGERRSSVWSKLGEAPLANSLAHLAVIAEQTANELGGASPEEMAKLYADGAWVVDDAALASIAAVRSSRGYTGGEPSIGCNLPAMAGRCGATSSETCEQATASRLPGSGVGSRSRRVRDGGPLRGRPPFRRCATAVGAAANAKGPLGGHLYPLGRSTHGDGHREARCLTGVGKHQRSLARRELSAGGGR